MRRWLYGTGGVFPPVAIGEVMRSYGVGRVIESRSASPHLQVGKYVVGLLGWQEECVVGESVDLEAVQGDSDFELRAALGLTGTSGVSAWVGVNIIDPRPGDTFIVSSAAGAVGSIAGQLARARGARVVGIAGGQRKCDLVRGKLGFDAAVDYKADGWLDHLAEATPAGIDAAFENVGGPVFEAVIDRLNNHARVAVCGLIATYNDRSNSTGPANFVQLVAKRLRMTGFIMHDHVESKPEALAEIRKLIGTGQLQPLETVVEGFESLPGALIGLFRGESPGKIVIHVGD
jgi:NADPH-dependent curcumin reductase CurA